MPVLIKTRDKAWNHYRDIMRGWSPKNRAKLKRVSGWGTFEDGTGFFSSVGIETNRTPLFWLDGGTRVRRRAMSPNWQSKTYGNIGLGPQRAGAGFPINVWGYYPGIEPRNFRNAVLDDLYYGFQNDIEDAFYRMYKELWA